MKVLYDARCTSCDNVDEVFGKKGDAVRCSVCSSPSRAIISPVQCQLEGVTGSFPGAAIRWERNHRAK